jgi:hypothetical protein
MDFSELRNLSPAERERLLKRAFPALFIAIVYFSFISKGVSEAQVTLKSEVERLRQGGNVGEALKPLQEENKSLLKSLQALENEQKAFNDEMARATEFLKQPDYANHVVIRLGEVLEDNRVRVVSESRTALGKLKDNMPKSYRELAGLANQAGYKGPALDVWTLHLTGSYQAMYRVMDQLNHDPLKIITVMLDMKAPQEGNDMQWILVLWI